MDLIKVMERFPDQESCIAHLEKIRWKGKPECPHCESSHVGKRTETKEGRIGRWNCHVATLLSRSLARRYLLAQKSRYRNGFWRSH